MCLDEDDQEHLRMLIDVFVTGHHAMRMTPPPNNKKRISSEI